MSVTASSPPSLSTAGGGAQTQTLVSVQPAPAPSALSRQEEGSVVAGFTLFSLCLFALPTCAHLMALPSPLYRRLYPATVFGAGK